VAGVAWSGAWGPGDNPLYHPVNAGKRARRTAYSAAADLGKAAEALHGLIELAEMTGRSGLTCVPVPLQVYPARPKKLSNGRWLPPLLDEAPQLLAALQAALGVDFA